MLSCQDNAAARDSLLSMYYMSNKILFDHLKVYHQISTKQEMEQTLILLISDISLYDLPGTNVKLPDKLSRHILEMDSFSINGEL